MKTTQLDTSAKEEEGGHSRGGGGLENQLELRLGISLSSGLEDMVTTTTTTTTTTTASTSYNGKHGVLCQSPGLLITIGQEVLNPPQEMKQGEGLGSCPKPSFNSFVHPWSLAARQHKAALEKAQHIPPTVQSRDTQHSPVPVVGWPPIRTFQKNSRGWQQLKVEMDEGKKTKRAKIIEERDISEVHLGGRTLMFVKVNMEGCAVGRKINLKAYDNYVSLSHGLQKMFTNFLSNSYYKSTKNDEQGGEPTPDYLLIYEDQEGDRMLVGDVPWEMFISSIKRLYIMHAQKSPVKADGRAIEQPN